MDIKFIGQGLDATSDNVVGNLISDSLSDGKYYSFRAFVAFISNGGINNISEQLELFKEKSDDIRLYVGVDLHATSEEALKRLMSLEIETYVVFFPNNVIYHPKIYVFEGEDFSRIIIGSSNFTVSGLFQNVEASVCIDFDKRNDEKGIQLLSDIYEHFNTIINAENASCQRLTEKILDILTESKVVLSEKANREKNNKANKDLEEISKESYSSLLKTFGKLKLKKSPKIKKKIVRKNTRSIDSDTKITTKAVELQNNSMWIETRKMTGGSRNILDMSKKGKNKGELINGSVSYFKIDPEDLGHLKEINILLGSDFYKSNPIKYAPGNSNWRLQLKGVTDSGLKLTVISNMKPGGFVNKILLFSHIESNDYKLEILEADKIEALINQSSCWGKMGNETTGRSYGFIQSMPSKD